MPHINFSTNASTRSATITASDSAVFEPTRSIWCVADGSAVMRFADDSADETYELVSGMVYPFCITMLKSSGTTATIKGLW